MDRAQHFFRPARQHQLDESRRDPEGRQLRPSMLRIVIRIVKIEAREKITEHETHNRNHCDQYAAAARLDEHEQN